ncbi:hypothetical protein [Butyrivibrio sp. WCD3002]|uniref:hypothetical protein n=1 Tax=Butyrivibrio sp. WCD3002 TaxID=1280676 RepID=UPI00040DB94A|nr:hypothetical protein [Butyrivibrio sp. WCD3002]
MQLMQMDDYYNSHSFAQRAIPYQDGFIFASEGDAYQRAFSVSFITPTEDKMTEEEYEAYYRSHEDQMNYWGEYPAYEPIDEARASYTGKERASVRNYDLFHFWLKKNKADDMYIVNNNFAHMGGIAVADNNHVALVGTSAKALDKKAAKQRESLFIQIFDPTSDLRNESSYAINSKRAGTSGIMGTDKVTDYGIKWLTDGKFEVKNPQVVADHKGRFVVLFEKYSGGRNQGVFYTIVDKSGKIARKITRFAGDACLNPCEMPKLSGKTIFWTANKNGYTALYTFKLKVK